MLKNHHKKRDFKKTKEPNGKSSSSQDARIFVIQKHHARSLHYDFRLEISGVLKSWAVPKGPSKNPADKRLKIILLNTQISRELSLMDNTEQERLKFGTKEHGSL